MWVFLKDAFLSIVEDRNSAIGDLLVRARVKGDIERVFPLATVRRTGGSDYAFRATISRGAVAAAIASLVSVISYDNFKASVPNKQRHDAYLRVWMEMQRYQESELSPRPKRKARRGRLFL